jgi:hypothetical protein
LGRRGVPSFFVESSIGQWVLVEVVGGLAWVTQCVKTSIYNINVYLKLFRLRREKAVPQASSVGQSILAEH